MVDQN